MAKDCSFDVVSDVDLQEVDNAVNQAIKEIGQRFDFRGSKSSITLEKDVIKLVSDDDFKMMSILSSESVRTSAIALPDSISKSRHTRYEQGVVILFTLLLTIMAGILSPFFSVSQSL